MPHLRYYFPWDIKMNGAAQKCDRDFALGNKMRAHRFTIYTILKWILKFILIEAYKIPVNRLSMALQSFAPTYAVILVFFR